VDFAFDLKKALQGINEQSFNHFVLKMGMSHLTYLVHISKMIFHTITMCLGTRAAETT